MTNLESPTPQISEEVSVKVLSELLARLEAATGPDPRLDGELDVLVGHENEAWPPPYTSTPSYLQAITPRLGLSVREVSDAALADLTPFEDVAIRYARALIKALIATNPNTRANDRTREGEHE